VFIQGLDDSHTKGDKEGGLSLEASAVTKVIVVSACFLMLRLLHRRFISVVSALCGVSEGACWSPCLRFQRSISCW